MDSIQITPLLQLYDIFIRGAEKKELTAALLLDLSAAFDVVDHRLLLQKLELYNFSSNTVSWFKSYLADRKQLVTVMTSRMQEKKVRVYCMQMMTLILLVIKIQRSLQ